MALIGGGNSAGHATVFLAEHVRRLHLVIRAPSLVTSVSSYLIDRLREAHNVEFYPLLALSSIKDGTSDRLEVPFDPVEKEIGPMTLEAKSLCSSSAGPNRTRSG